MAFRASSLLNPVKGPPRHNPPSSDTTNDVLLQSSWERHRQGQAGHPVSSPDSSQRSAAQRLFRAAGATGPARQARPVASARVQCGKRGVKRPRGRRRQRGRGMPQGSGGAWRCRRAGGERGAASPTNRGRRGQLQTGSGASRSSDGTWRGWMGRGARRGRRLTQRGKLVRRAARGEKKLLK